MRFSERIGVKPLRLEFQRDGIDDALRAGLWTALSTTVLKFKYEYNLYGRSNWGPYFDVISTQVYVWFFKRPIDRKPNGADDFVKLVRDWFFKAEWFEVYDFIEFVYDVQKSQEAERGGKISDSLAKLVNGFLEEEQSAYRLVDGQVTDITNEAEQDSVEAAANPPAGFQAAGTHIRTALALYSDRKNHNYRNVIKEAISAVEATCRLISDQPKATLGDALKTIDNKHGLHPSLKEGLLKLYGYTSDQGGIRHSLLEADNVDAPDAKFMLVSCSAFCNFLIERYGKTS